MMLFAATAMLVTSFSTTSCSKDNDDTLATYTISATIETGNLPSDVAKELKNNLGSDKTFVATLSEAKSEFSNDVSKVNYNFQTAIDGLKASGYTGISITIYLKDSTGKVLESKTWS